MNLYRAQLTCLSLVLASLVATAIAQAPPAEATSIEQALRAKWQGVYTEIAASMEMKNGNTKLRLYEDPLLFYTNPVRTTDQHGSIFLWTEEGRPALIGSIWSALNRNDASIRNITHEWHSLLEDADVAAAQDGQLLWTSGEAGVKWRITPDNPLPAATRSARLAQMRSIARRFSARITTDEGGELRLMPQPLYRYPETENSPRDGALFALALATDPELILLIDLWPTRRGEQYRVAFARFGNLAMEVKDGDRVAWTCDQGTPGRSEGKYYLHWRVAERPANLGTPAAKAP